MVEGHFKKMIQRLEKANIGNEYISYSKLVRGEKSPINRALHFR